MNKQTLQFALFICVICLGTSLVYHALNQTNISLRRAHQHVSQGHYAEAVVIYEKLLSQGLQSEEVNKGLIACHTSLKNPERAVVALQALIAQNKDVEPTRVLYLAATALGMGKNDVAVAEYRKVLILRPDDRSARLGLARALARLGQVNEAVIEYRMLLGEQK